MFEPSTTRGAIGAPVGREARMASVGIARRDVLLTAAAVLAVTGPLLFTRSGFALDFTNALWLVSVAGRSLVEAGHPSYFIHAPPFDEMGVFYPWFAFYGGPLYMLAGGVAELIGGHPEIAFVGLTLLAVIGAYGGTLWLGRELGLRGWLAHAPALTVITSAYYITDMYGRGAWPELLGTSAIAPLVAGAVHLVRAPRWRALPVAVFAGSVAIFTGSHNITVLWGTTIGAAALLVLWLALGAPRRLPYRRLAMVAALGLASSLVNAWFLLPDIADAGNTYLGGRPLPGPGAGGSSIWPVTSYLQTPAVLLNPLRAVPRQSGTPALYVQAPDWFLLWGLAAGALLLWRGSLSRERSGREQSEGAQSVGALRRAWVAAAVTVALLLGMLMIARFWDLVPYPFDEIQFPYRLGSYLFYAVAGLVLVGALALQRAAAADGPLALQRAAAADSALALPRAAPADGSLVPQRAAVSGGSWQLSRGSRRLIRGLRLALAGVCAVSLGLCLWQQWVPSTLFVGQSYTNRDEALVGPHAIPRTWYDPGSYHDRREPLVAFAPARVLTVPLGEVHGDRFAGWVNAPPGPEPIKTNIGAGDYLVRIGGLRWLGRSPAGFAVVARIAGGSGPVYVTIETARALPIELGRLLSVVGAIAVLAVLLYVGPLQQRMASSRPGGAADPTTRPE